MLDNRPDAPSVISGEFTPTSERLSATASVSLQPYLRPSGVEPIAMQGYIPYSRRKIIQVLPPVAASPGQPAFMAALYRLVTVAAPWTPEECWRARSPNIDSDDDVNEDDFDGDDREMFALEKESATIEEPEKIELWCEAEQFSGDIQCVVGAGLRGRWALMGGPQGPQWWIFKAKDCKLADVRRSSEYTNQGRCPSLPVAGVMMYVPGRHKVGPVLQQPGCPGGRCCLS